MSTIIEILTAAALILSIIIPGGAFLLGERNKKRYKKSLAVNCFFFFGTLLVGTIAMFAGAQNVQAATDAAGSGLATGLGYLGAAPRNRPVRHRFRYRRSKFCKCSPGCYQRRRFPVR